MIHERGGPGAAEDLSFSLSRRISIWTQMLEQYILDKPHQLDNMRNMT